MLIDWFTIAAQLINFLILVWLMKRFLYKPILHAIDEREKHVASRLADAAQKDSDAQAKIEEFKKKNEDFDQQKSEAFEKALSEAQTEKERLMEGAKEAAVALKTKQSETLVHEKKAMQQSIRDQTVHQIFAVSRKALADLAGVSLEERIVDVFVKQLNALDETEKEAISKSFKDPESPPTVRCAFALDTSLQNTVQDAVWVISGQESPLEFITSPKLISGIELATADNKISWNIEDYLDSLQASLEESAHKDQHSKPKSKTKHKSSPRATSERAGDES